MVLKSRSKWLHSGDRNTKFFHGVTAVRRKKNTYDILQEEEGNWVGEPTRIETMVTKYYRDLFAGMGLEMLLALQDLSLNLVTKRCERSTWSSLRGISSM